MKHKILVVEDNVDTATNIRLFLEHNDYLCELVHSGTAAIEQFVPTEHDLVILDIMLPDLSGHEVCSYIRKISTVPIIMLTAKVTDQDLSNGLDIGADDYIRKPYSNKELIARVKAHLRRYHNLTDSNKTGSYEISNINQSIKVNEVELALTVTEYKLMAMLLASPGRIFSREQLYLAVFENTHDSLERAIDVHLHNLRKKIQKAGLREHGIKSVYGSGYKLEMK